MAWDYQFVDRIVASPTVRLDLKADWFVREDTDFGVPELRRSVTSSLLVDGELYPAAAYGGRTVTLVLEHKTPGSPDSVAASLQTLFRELDRPRGVLRYQPGTSEPVHFRTFRAGPSSVRWDAARKVATVEIPAEPFAVGLKETLPQVTVYNDPAEGVTLNANPFFETNAAGWTGVGGTIVRSTAQFMEGAASLLLTPSGAASLVSAQADPVAVTAGQQYRASAWVRCAVARSISVTINWFDAVGTYLTTAAAPTVAVAANTWTLIDGTYTAPAGAAQAQLVAGNMASTPPASNTVHIDVARLRQVGDQGGMCFDLAGSAIKGDVETPLFLSFVAGDVLVTGRRQSAIAVRRRGTPSAMPMVVQAETLSVDTDTTVQTNSAVMSGSGSNFTRTTFAAPAMNRRLYMTSAFPAAPSPDTRGTYRAFARIRKSVSGDVITMRLTAEYNGAIFSGDTTTLPSGTDLRWVDLGLLPYPVGYDPVGDGYSGSILAVTGSALSVWAARASGSGNLDIDALLLVPADDRYCQVQWSPYSGPTALVLDSNANAVYGVGAGGELAPTDLMELSGLPPMVTPGQAARIVFVRDVGTTSSGGDDKTGSTRITPYYWPRYVAITRPVAS